MLLTIKATLVAIGILVMIAWTLFFFGAVMPIGNALKIVLGYNPLLPRGACKA